MIAFWSVITVILTSLLVSFILSGHFSNPFRWNFNYSGPTGATKTTEKSFACDGIDKINLSVASADVSFSKSPDNNIRVTVEGTTDSQGNNLFDVAQSGSTIEITQKSRDWGFFLFYFGSVHNRVSIQLPESYKKDLSASLTSGDITFNGDYTFGNADIRKTSGDVNGGSITADTFTFKSTSGDSNLSKVCANYTISSISGDIKISDLEGHGSVNTTSGEFSCNISKLDGSFNYSAISGDAQIGIAKGIGANLSANTVSGDVSANFDLEYNGRGSHNATAKIGNSPYNSMSFSTTSGDIRLNLS